MGHEEDIAEIARRIVANSPDNPAGQPRSLSDPQAPRFADLPAITREFFLELRKDDIDYLRKSIEFQRNTKIIKRFMFMVGGTAFTFFVGAVAFGEKIIVAWKWVMGAKQ